MRLGTEPKPVTSSVGFGTGPNRDRLSLACPNKRTPIPEKIGSLVPRSLLTRSFSWVAAATLLGVRCHAVVLAALAYLLTSSPPLAFAKATANPPLLLEQGAGTIYPNTYRLDVTGVPGNFEIIRRLYA